MHINSDPKPQHNAPGFPTSYHGLHWASINRVKDYLYRQLSPVLEDAAAYLSAAERADASRGRGALVPVAQRLEMARNTLSAWAVLVTVESGGLVSEGRRLPVAASALPLWLTEHIRTRTTLTADYTRPLFVHPEVFFESLLLLSQTGDEIGALLQVTLTDASDSPRGVWLRAVFVPPLRGAYSGMSTLLNALNARPDAEEAAFRLQVTSSLMKINESRLVLQYNRKTGEQALAALLPTLTTEDLRSGRGEGKRSPWRSTERHFAAASAPSDDLLQPFRLDDDSDLAPSEVIVPAFAPGALESWLESPESEPEPPDDVTSPDESPPQPPES